MRVVSIGQRRTRVTLAIVKGGTLYRDVLSSGAFGVWCALLAACSVTECATGTVMAIGMSGVVPSEPLSFGAVLGGARSIRDHVVVLWFGTHFTGDIVCLHAVSLDAQITSGRT